MRDYSWATRRGIYHGTEEIPTSRIVEVLQSNDSLANSAALNGVDEATLRERLRLELDIRKHN